MGRVPVAGVMPVSPRFDTVGPMARSAVDVARLFTVIARDSLGSTFPQPGRSPGAGQLFSGIRGMRVGIPEEFFYEDVDGEIDVAVRSAARMFEELGAQLVATSLPGAERARDCLATMAYADAGDLHRERMRSAPEVFSEPVRRRLQLALRISHEDVRAAESWRAEWNRRVRQLFRSVDIVVTPTVPIEAPRAEGSESLANSAALGRFTAAWSLATGPSLSVPCGFHESGLPIGMMIAAAPGREDLLLRAAISYQANSDWHLRTPAMAPAGSGTRPVT
jgi:aspartyl-tRNA(Asn)/glutamyl-tRNA(Gln) amidotransferase subunit A